VTLRVYAIASHGTVPRVRGVRLRAIGFDGVWAIVASARRTPAASPANLRQHHRVVAAIAAESTAVLPARFGAVMDETELEVILRSRRPALAASLRHVRGQVQMTLRVLEPAGSPPIERSGGRRAWSRRSGREYLLDRAAAASSRQIPGFAPIRNTLGRWIRDERVERAKAITSVYHLIPRRAVTPYRRAAAAAIDDSGQRVVLSGPFPPYAFASW